MTIIKEYSRDWFLVSQNNFRPDLKPLWLVKVIAYIAENTCNPKYVPL